MTYVSPMVGNKCMIVLFFQPRRVEMKEGGIFPSKMRKYEEKEAYDWIFH